MQSQTNDFSTNNPLCTTNNNDNESSPTHPHHHSYHHFESSIDVDNGYTNDNQERDSAENELNQEKCHVSNERHNQSVSLSTSSTTHIINDNNNDDNDRRNSNENSNDNSSIIRINENNHNHSNHHPIEEISIEQQSVHDNLLNERKNAHEQLEATLHKIRDTTKTLLNEIGYFLESTESVTVDYMKCQASQRNEARRLEEVEPDVTGATERYLQQVQGMMMG